MKNALDTHTHTDADTHTDTHTGAHRHTDTESCLVPALSDGPKVEIAMPETLHNLNEEHGERGCTDRKNIVKSEDIPLKYF